MDSVSRLNGGLFEAERNLWRELADGTDCQIEVLGLRDRFSDVDLHSWSPLVPQLCAVRGPESFGYSAEMAKKLQSKDGNLVYCPGLWKYPSRAAFQWANANSRPMVIAPHGMLDGWALRNSRTKKSIAGLLYQNVQLKGAVCLRALCRSEADSIRAYGLTNPICVIRNGVKLPEKQESFSTKDSPLSHINQTGKKILLYLGRLHPKKGIANLLRSWSELRPSEWVLAIAGWGEESYERELRREAPQSGIGNSVIFLGPQFDDDKAACYRGCDAFILPSLSEGLPMAVLEAWSYGKSVLITPQCNFPEAFTANAAIRIEPSVESIATGLRTLFNMSKADRHEMGHRGLNLVATRFTWPEVVAQMHDLFTWAINRGPKPSTVEFV